MTTGETCLGFEPNRVRLLIRRALDQATEMRPSANALARDIRLLRKFTSTMLPYARVRAESLAPGELRQGCERAIVQARTLKDADVPTAALVSLAEHAILLAAAVEELLPHAERFDDAHPPAQSVPNAPPDGAGSV